MLHLPARGARVTRPPDLGIFHSSGFLPSVTPLTFQGVTRNSDIWGFDAQICFLLYLINNFVKFHDNSLWPSSFTIFRIIKLKEKMGKILKVSDLLKE